MKVFSDDGKWVDVKVEKKKFARTVGKDFVSGGLHDYVSSTKTGFVVTIRTDRDADYKKTAKITRDTITEELGSPPIVMPPAYASGLIVLEWNGDTNKTEEEMFSSIGISIKGTKLKKRLF